MTKGAFEELENRCKKLRNKRVLKIFLLCFVLLISAVSLVFTVGIGKNSKKEPRKIEHKKIDKTVADKANKIESKSKTEKHIKVEKKEPLKVDKNVTVKRITKTVQKPIKIKQKKDIKVLYLKPQIDIKSIIEKKQDNHKNKKKAIKKSITKKVQKKSEVIQKKSKKPNFKIEIKQSDKKPVNIYDEALISAKNSFKKKKYIKCIYWAKKASKLNSSKAEPWILYAKAKYKLGRKREAMDSLRTYLNYFNSKDALDLLKKYEGAKK